jgi:hypothetical protein
VTAKTSAGVNPRELTWPTAPPPISVTDSYWVYARRKGRISPPTDRSGEWLVFVKRDLADALWSKIARATTEGKLGPAAKCGTARHNPNSTYRSTTVICV